MYTLEYMHCMQQKALHTSCTATAACAATAERTMHAGMHARLIAAHDMHSARAVPCMTLPSHRHVTHTIAMPMTLLLSHQQHCCFS
jgi:hypothetical protein